VVRYANQYFQLEAQSRHYAPARSKVLVCEGRHGGIRIEYRGRALGWKQIAAPLKPAPRAEAVRTRRGRPCETEVGAAGGPPLARGGPARRAAKSAAGGGPSTVGWALRCALNAPPCGLRRAPLRSQPTDRKKPGCRSSSSTRIVAPRASGREIS
jgi:hypothetical protein